MIQICQLCKGVGKVVGMGCVISKCSECNGVGSIEVKEQEDPIVLDKINITEVIVENVNENDTKRTEENKRKQVAKKRKSLH